VTRVSIVIPVYNTERYLPECLFSVASQTLEDYEVICVNDGSTDDSRDILSEYASQDSRVTIIDQENQGLAGARNTGLDYVSGDYVMFLDADDFLEPTTVEEVYTQCANDDADIGIYKIRYVYAGRDTSVVASWSLRMDLVPEKVPFSRHDMPGKIYTFVTPAVWNKMFKRSFLIDEGLSFHQELRRAEDIPFTYLALAKAKRITVIDKPLVNYRTGMTDSLQATIHERPLEICNSLTRTKNDLVEAGLLGDLEADLVNAVLHQFLFTLESLKTMDAFTELYDALKNRYFAELGVDDLPSDQFFDEQNQEQYLKIRNLTAETYLFDETRALRSRLADRVGDVRVLRGRLAESWKETDSVREKLRETRERLDETAEQLAKMELRLKKTESRLRKTQAKIERIQASRAYRFARYVSRISTKFSRFFRRFGKAK
jgi:glycosyltransferase involved in cell wall biosynthesis